MSDQDATTRLNEALEGRYRIDREIGQGGMATVYLADDLRHERKVAVKVLRPELAAVVGAERFLAEIKTTANLQHPHILPLFDSGEAESFLFYVMPYVQGETLREKLDRETQLGVDDALALTRKVADALDYAHEHGVVHRDIKPGNILLSERGEPLVADFGIALAVAQAGGGRITETGLSLGTPHYMSPEQATGDRDVNPRSDVYALGCVLYEMLAGEPPFSASTAQAILAKILTMDAPSITMVRRTVAPNVGAALAKALEKLPADRFASAADFATALYDDRFTYEARVRTPATSAPQVVAVPEAKPWLRDARSAAAVAVGMLMTLLAAWGWLRSPTAPPPGVPTRVAVEGMDQTITGGGWRLAISPDGRYLLTVEEGAIYVRRADEAEWRLLPNSEGASNPTFSPDGRSVAFTIGGGISRVSIDGGVAFPVVGQGREPHWGFDDTIVYEDGGAVYRVAANGGEPELLFASDTLGARRAHLLPNGRGVVFGTGASDASGIAIYEVETGAVRRLLAAGNQPRYVPTGHLIFGDASGALMGVAFDLETLEVAGAPVTLLPSMAVFGGGASQFAVSDNGTLLYATANRGGLAPGVRAPLVWVDLEGNETPLPLPPAEITAPRVSPEGDRIAYVQDGHVWVSDVGDGVPTQLTFEGRNESPIWSKNGQTIYFMSERTGTSGFEVFAKAADGSSDAVRLGGGEGEPCALTSLSPDEGWLVATGCGSVRSVLLAALGPDGVEFQEYSGNPWEEYEGAISPDGRWMAYSSAESGSNGIIVRGFPEPAGQWRVASGLAFDPAWAPDGSAIYYTNPPDNFMRVDVNTGGTFSFGQPTVLFPWRYNPGGGVLTGYDVHPDGDRFLLSTSTRGGFGDVYIVTNWFEELRERMGGGVG